jgi:Protein of unknown function (DUF5672)
MGRMSRLSLPQVTLCAADARSPELAAEALGRSMAQVDFGCVKLFTHAWAGQPDGIEVVDVGPIRSGAEYSRFILKRLPEQVTTPFVLVSQWDGFVVDASAWQDEFLEYDYIGAVWADQPAALSVGNGGFSLRSQRLLRAGHDANFTEQHPEDVALCRSHRDVMERTYGVRFAPPSLARRFAYENESPRAPTFGFHGPKNLPAALDAATITRWLDRLPDDFFRGRDARRLARALLAHRMAGVASRLIARRQSAGRRDAQTRLLGALATALTGFDS